MQAYNLLLIRQKREAGCERRENRRKKNENIGVGKRIWTNGKWYSKTIILKSQDKLCYF